MFLVSLMLSKVHFSIFELIVWIELNMILDKFSISQLGMHYTGYFADIQLIQLTMDIDIFSTNHFAEIFSFILYWNQHRYGNYLLLFIIIFCAKYHNQGQFGQFSNCGNNLCSYVELCVSFSTPGSWCFGLASNQLLSSDYALISAITLTSFFSQYRPILARIPNLSLRLCNIWTRSL